MVGGRGFGQGRPSGARSNPGTDHGQVLSSPYCETWYFRMSPGLSRRNCGFPMAPPPLPSRPIAERHRPLPAATPAPPHGPSLPTESPPCARFGTAHRMATSMRAPVLPTCSMICPRGSDFIPTQTFPECPHGPIARSPRGGAREARASLPMAPKHLPSFGPYGRAFANGGSATVLSSCTGGRVPRAHWIPLIRAYECVDEGIPLWGPTHRLSREGAHPPNARRLSGITRERRLQMPPRRIGPVSMQSGLVLSGTRTACANPLGLVR
jgi:hypothetical protein